MALGKLFVLAAALLLAIAATPATAFWAITKEPIQWEGKAVPAGMLVPFMWDGGDFYYSSSYKDADHIPKESLQPLEKIAPSRNTFGSWDTNCKLYMTEPLPARPVASLLSEELRNSAPHSTRSVQIVFKEGNTFVIRFPGPVNTDADERELTRRVSENCISFTNVKSFNGLTIMPPFQTQDQLMDRPIDWNIWHHTNVFWMVPVIIFGLIIVVFICGSLAYRLAR